MCAPREQDWFDTEPEPQPEPKLELVRAPAPVTATARVPENIGEHMGGEVPQDKPSPEAAAVAGSDAPARPHEISVTFTEPGTLGLAFGSTAPTDPPSIQEVRARTQAVDHPALRPGLVRRPFI